MIVLGREKAEKLKILESLLHRVDESDHEWSTYKNMYMTLKKGYEGEIQVDRHWQEIAFPSTHFILHNYETVNEQGYSHQIDTLLLTSHFIWILEIKNITGQIDIDDFKHQLIRTNPDGSKNSFKSPINQINRHAQFLYKRLNSLGMKLPIETAIVMANDSTIIGAIANNFSIFHASGLQRELNKHFTKYSRKAISPSQLEKLKVELLKGYARKTWKPKIDLFKLKKGVLCRECGYKRVMTFEYGMFYCQNCGAKSKVAHLEALLDYRNLFGEWISNRELREFMGIQSQYAANRILKRLDLETRGTYRNRMYKIPESFRERC